MAQLDALTSIRFIAAAIVVLFHMDIPLIRVLPSWVQRVIGSAGPAVWFFFILSGFILGYVQCKKTKQGTKIDRSAFWAGRFARIFPVYLFCLGLAYPIYLYAMFLHRLDWSRLVPSLSVFLLLQSWSREFAQEVNVPAWSLSVEAFFYAIFPFVFDYMRGKRFQYVLCVCVPLIVLAQQYQQSLPLPIYHLPMFLYGLILGISFSEQGVRIKGKLFFYILVIGICAIRGQAWSSQSMGIEHFLSVIFLGLLVLSIASNAGAMSLLEHRLFVDLGKWSYALYLVHLPLIMLARKAVKPFDWLHIENNFTVFGLLVLALIGASSTMYTLLEMPTQKFILGKLRRV